MAAHTSAVLTTHSRSHISCTHNTWPLTHQLYSPHMATHTQDVLTTHSHSRTSCTHHTWSLTHQLFSPHMVTHTPAILTTHGHSHTSYTHHTWPLTQQLYSPHMATHTAAVLTTQRSWPCPFVRPCIRPSVLSSVKPSGFRTIPTKALRYLTPNVGNTVTMKQSW